MDSSDEEVLLESCCYHQEQIKREWNRTWIWEMFKKGQNKEFTKIYCRRQLSMTQRIALQAICIMNFLAKLIKKNVQAFKVWLDPFLFIKILLETAQLLSKSFPSGLSLCIIYFVFHKDGDTSVIRQPSVQHLVYVFPIFFCFHKCFNNFHLSKNILINKFFHRNMCFTIVLPP